MTFPLKSLSEHLDLGPAGGRVAFPPDGLAHDSRLPHESAPGRFLPLRDWRSATFGGGPASGCVLQAVVPVVGTIADIGARDPERPGPP